MDRLALTQEGHARLIDHLRGWIERYPKNSLVWFALIVATLDQEGHREAAHLVRRWDRERDAALNSEWYWRAESLTDLSLLGVPTTMPAPIFDTDIPGEDTIPFIDREQERAQLSRLVRLLASGQGGIQVVTGEPGVGKTRMLSVLSQFAVRQGIRPVKIDCCEYALPLQPWRDLLPPLWSESLRDPRTPLRALTRHRVLLLRLLGPNGLDPALPGPAQGVERLTDLAVQLVRHATARQPLLLFLENAHHLDPDSLLVLERLVPRLASQPIMILITLRHAEVPPDSHLAKWLDGRDSLEILPLDRDYTERLMECILGERPTREMVAIALRHTGGNPLLLLQGLAMNALDKPLELGNMAKSMLLPTVRSLTKPCQEWLKAAAVLAVGQGFSPRLVNGMLRYSATIGDACVGEARRARVVAPSNDRFCHDLWRDVILSETNGDAGRARYLHERAFIVLRDHSKVVGMSDGLSTRLALHALDAYPNVDTAMVTDATLEASRRARRVSAFQSAVRLCDRALAVADRPEQRFDLLLEEGDAHHDAANLEDADRLYGAAWDLAVDNGQARRQGLSALRRARIWWVAFTPRPGHRERLEAAIVALGTDEPLLRAELEAHLASTMSDEDWQAARSLAYRAWSQANRTEDRAMTCELLVGARNGLFQTASPNELLAISTRIKRCSSGDHSEHFRDEAFNAMVCDLLRLGRFKEVQQEVEEQRQRVRETRRPWSAYLLESVESLLALWEGRWHDAGQHLAQMEAFLKGTDNALLGARGTVEQLVIAQKAWLAHERGATLALEEHTEVVATAMRRAGNAAVWQTGLALLALETGDYSQASSAVAAVVQNSGDPSAFPPHGWGVPTLFLLAEVCAALCQHEFKGRAMAGEIDLRVLARDVRRLLLPHRQEMGLAGWPAVMLGPIARAVGLAELAGGSPEGAIPLLEEAAQWTPLSPPLRARLSLDMAQAMLRTNRRDYEVMAKKYLEVSVREATRLGMSAVASRAGEMLQEIE